MEKSKSNRLLRTIVDFWLCRTRKILKIRSSQTFAENYIYARELGVSVRRTRIISVFITIYNITRCRVPASLPGCSQSIHYYFHDLYARDRRNDIRIRNRLAHDWQRVSLFYRMASIGCCALLINTKIKNCLLLLFIIHFCLQLYVTIIFPAYIITMLSYIHIRSPTNPSAYYRHRRRHCSDLYSYLPCCPPPDNVIYSIV